MRMTGAMKLTVCTGWTPEGWISYGRKFWESFARFWPRSVDLLVYGEDGRTPSGGGPNMRMLPLTEIPDLVAFRERWKGDARANGREVLPTWKPARRTAGYNFKFDAWKFAPQGFIPWEAFSVSRSEFLIWLDGDVITHAPVTESMITSLLPEDKDIGFLGRGDKHPDIAFQIYRRGPIAEAFIEDFAAMYDSDDLFDLKEWHSAYVWKYCLDRRWAKWGHDITPGGEGHVWHESPLAQWGDHLKGKRKDAGRSPERRR